MAAQDNKALTRRYVDEAFNKGNMAVIDEVIATNYTVHPMPPDRRPGIEGERDFVRMVRAEWPDLQITVDDQVAEGDKVVTRWTVRATHTQSVTSPYGSLPATNKQVTLTGINIDRIEGGKVVESWSNADDLGLMQQLGAVPAPAQQQAAR